MNTVAFPATCEPGSFASATEASTAASYWIGPSTSNPSARIRTRSVASRTLSTSAPQPGAPVEYDSIATRGSSPNWAAVCAEERAMSASWGASGSGLTAQSPYTSTRSARHMKNTDDTIEVPGTVLMISKEG